MAQTQRASSYECDELAAKILGIYNPELDVDRKLIMKNLKLKFGIKIDDFYNLIDALIPYAFNTAEYSGFGETMVLDGKLYAESIVKLKKIYPQTVD